MHRVHRVPFVLLLALTIVVCSQAQTNPLQQVASLRPSQELLWQRVSPTSQRLDGPAESQGRISGPAGAAAKLGLPSRTLDSKIKRLKINKYRFKAQAD